MTVATGSAFWNSLRKKKEEHDEIDNTQVRLWREIEQ